MKQLGSTNRKIFPVGLGGRSLSIRISIDERLKIIKKFYEAGGSLIDTANVYGESHLDHGQNERDIASAIKKLGLIANNFIIATKGGYVRPDYKRWILDCRPAKLRAACLQSLKNLTVESIDLYQLHGVDKQVPFVDQIGALVDLKKSGYIQHIGLSNVNTQQLAIATKMTAITSIQNRCNQIHQEDIDSGLVDYCHRNHISYLAHSPFAYKKVRTFQASLEWLCGFSSIIPIPGASSAQQVEHNMQGAFV